MQAIENHSQKSTKRSEGHNVKKVIDFRLDNGKRYYKVKWETSWELEDNLQEYQNVLNEFWSFVDRVKVDREEPPQRKKARLINTDDLQQRATNAPLHFSSQNNIATEITANDTTAHTDLQPANLENLAKITTQSSKEPVVRQTPENRVTIVKKEALPMAVVTQQQQQQLAHQSQQQAAAFNTSTESEEGGGEDDKFRDADENAYQEISRTSTATQKHRPASLLNEQAKKLDMIVSKLGIKEENVSGDENISSANGGETSTNGATLVACPKKKRTPTNCVLCNKHFNYRSNMVRHMKSVHKVTKHTNNNNNEPFNFSDATRYENSMVMLDNSLMANNNTTFQQQVEESNSEEIITIQQGQYASSTDNLSQRSDNTIKRVKVMSTCKTCGKQFNHKSNMYRHVRVVHNNTRVMHPCVICARTFTESSNLRRHIMNSHKL